MPSLPGEGSIPMQIRYNDREFKIERHPPSGDQSLRAASAADEHILRHIEESGEGQGQPAIFHDRFGALSVPLNGSAPRTSIILKSQQNSILHNLELNDLASEAVEFLDPLEAQTETFKWALMRIPKSLELFRLTLSGLSRTLDEKGTVTCGFMTRHFSPQILSIAGEYFETVEQSRAWKKSRLLHLSGPRRNGTDVAFQTIELDDETTLHQYPGVFSGGHIDYATRFLLENLKTRPVDMRILDLGCGNGVISVVLQRLQPEAEIHVLDDNWLAIESAKKNLPGSGVTYHWTGTLEILEPASFDLVVSNPPYHFENEIDLSVPLRLFSETRNVLKPGGFFLMVANKHLNYRTQLAKIFDNVALVAANEKFEVLQAGVSEEVE